MSHFAYLTNIFNLKKPETYKKVMTSNQAEEWAEVIKQKIDLFIQYETWDFISKTNIQLGYQPLKKKWIYKIKRGIDN